MLCFALLLFSSQLLSLFQMSTEMLENSSILISTVTGWKTCCGMGFSKQKACFLYNLWGFQRELFVSFLSSTTSFLIFPFSYGLLDLLFIDSKH